jgi:hypothetical protein
MRPFHTPTAAIQYRSTTMHSLGEWGPTHLRDQPTSFTLDDVRDEDGQLPDDN